MTRRFSFVLPSDWWRIPLVNEEARTANIDHMVDHYFPNVDEATQLRHDLKDELRKQAAQAAHVGGLVMAFYILSEVDTPITATMTCYDVSGLMSLPSQIDPAKVLAQYVGDKTLDESLPDLADGFRSDDARIVPPTDIQAPIQQTGQKPVTTESENGPVPDPTEGNLRTVASILDPLRKRYADRPDVLEVLDQAQAYASEPAPESSPTSWNKVEPYDILAYRQDYISEGTDYFGADTPKIPNLQVQYLQVVPDFGLVQTTFSTPLINARDSWIPMFDAMVATFRSGSPEEPTTQSKEA